MKIVNFFARIFKVFLILFVLGALFLNLFTVSVPAGYSAYIRRFGREQNIHTEPGLHLRLPIDDVVLLPINMQVYNLTPSDVITLDKKTMNVSSFVLWQITNTRSVMENLGHVMEVNNRTEYLIYNAIKNTMSSMDQEDLITQRGEDLTNEITNIGATSMAQFGVDVLSVRISKFDLPDDNKDAVFRRMISERDSISAKFLAEGEEEAKMIRNSIRPERDILISTAQAEADLLRAQGEAEYMSILSDAFEGPDRLEFYEFIRSLDALKLAMQGDKTLFLPLDSPLMGWLDGY